jgi:hypothetical protein
MPTIIKVGWNQEYAASRVNAPDNPTMDDMKSPVQLGHAVNNPIQVPRILGQFLFGMDCFFSS